MCGGGFAIGPDFTLFLVSILFGSHFTGEERAGCFQIYFCINMYVFTRRVLVTLLYAYLKCKKKSAGLCFHQEHIFV